MPSAAALTGPFACLLYLGAIWGTVSVVAKAAMLAGVPPLAYGFWQCVLASVLLTAVSAARGSLPALDRAHLRYFAFTGIVGISVPTFVMYLAVSNIPAGLMSAIVATAPLMTYGLALGVRTERFDMLRGAGLGFGFVGALLLIAPDGTDRGFDVGWAALALLTPALYAVNAVVAGRFMPKADALALAAGMTGFGAIGFGLASAVAGELWLPWPLDHGGVWAVVWHGVSSAVAYGLYFRIIRLAGPVYMSQVGYIVVALGVVAGMLAFGERHAPIAWAAMAAMVAGLAFVNVGTARRRGRSHGAAER